VFIDNADDQLPIDKLDRYAADATAQAWAAAYATALA
jgi:hypothetical protein